MGIPRLQIINIILFLNKEVNIPKYECQPKEAK